MASRLLTTFSVNDHLEYPRMIMIALSLLYAFTKRKVVFYSMVALWAIGVVIRVYSYYGI